MSENPGGPELQFDTVIPPPLPGADAAPAGVSCALCTRPISDEYFDVNGQTVCRVCRVRVLEAAETPTEWGVFLRAMACGVVAAIAGAILYFAVIAITDFEIGLVAIAIGFMVGYAVRFGAGGSGGRRFQVMALVLTYVAVSLAYTILAVRAGADQAPTETTASTSTGSAPPSSAASSGEAVPGAADTQAAPSEGGDESFALSLVFFALFCLALPVLVIADSFPSGLISAAIIAFGMQQAWRMTGKHALTVTGPYRVGAATAPV